MGAGRRRKTGRSRARRSAGADPAEAPLPVAVACPFCSSSETELFSPFGSLASVAQYYCRSCRTVFDYLKWEPEAG